jgi:uncharacterized protein (TIGR02231 family)
MRHFTLRTALVVTSTFIAIAPSLHAHPAQDAVLVAESVTANSAIREVTLYQGRAMVSRAAQSPAREGMFEIRFDGLPSTLDSASLQATVASDRGGAKLLDVRYEEKVTRADVTNNPELKEAIAKLEAAKRLGETLAMQMAAINDRYTLLNAVRQKTATESAKDFGSKSLDPDALGKQIAFLDAAQAQLIADRAKLDGEIRTNTDDRNALQAKVNGLGGQSKVERTAIVTVGQSIAQAATVTLRYLVTEAGWKPRYSVRADIDGGSLAIEYDAEILQATGEDWKDVKLTLSTAQPTQKAAPDDVPSAYVDVFVPPPPIERADGAMYDMPAAKSVPGAPRPAGPAGGLIGSAGEGGEYVASAAVNLSLAANFSDVIAASNGTVVSYPLPRAITIPSDGQRSRKQRIATVDTKPAFTHVARPLVESAVYIKAVVANSSAFQFLEGPAIVFLGGDSVGATMLPDIAPGAEMTFWLGTDRRIEAKRVLVKKETTERGVFGKADETVWQYRVDLTSTDTRPATVELVDRMPVSRNEQIKVELKDLSQPLATDAKYLADEKPQGILKWLVQLPARTAAGKPAAQSVSWRVILSKPKDVQVTGVPE